jgi:hypothetical protein
LAPVSTTNPPSTVAPRSPLSGDRLTFVLTLALSNTGRDDLDLQRFRLLLASLHRYLDADCLEEFIIVAPGRDLQPIRETASQSLSPLRIETLDELDICPEFKAAPDTLNSWPRPNTGWFRQQLIKLAIHDRVTTPFYMTLDSDVLFVREFDVGALFPGGKAALNVQTADDFKRLYSARKARHEVKVRQARYREAEHVLRLQRPESYSHRWYGETPVLLNRRIVADLARHVSDTWQLPWRRALLEKLPWTEYALYFLFAESRGALEACYAPGTADTLLRLSQSLWLRADDYATPRGLSDWHPDEIFEVEKEGVAVVVLSYLGYPVGEIADLFDRFVR